MWNYNILLKITGSIAAFKIVGLASELKKWGLNIKVVGTPDAKNFIGASTWEGITGEPYQDDIYESGKAHNHIHLQRWADLILLAPATANSINKLANGIGDNLVGSLFLAHDFKKPYLLVPAMNSKMYEHPATQESLNKLKKWGIHIIEPKSGVLACGETGAGRMAEIEDLISAIATQLRALNKNDKAKNILITGGGTQESIDDVRFIANHSTGKTASQLADYFYRKGDNVIYLHGRSAQLPNSPVTKNSFTDFVSLKEKLYEILSKQKIDLVIHAAAVSDYSLKSHFTGKLSSKDSEIQLTLKQNEKLVDHVKKISANPKVQLFAFKLTSTESNEEKILAVSDLFSHSSADYIIQNDFLEITSGKHQFNIYKQNQMQPLDRVNNPEQLAKTIENFSEVYL